MYALGCLALAATVASCGSNANKKASGQTARPPLRLRPRPKTKAGRSSSTARRSTDGAATTRTRRAFAHGPSRTAPSRSTARACGEAQALEDGGDLIFANKKFKNFELEFEWKVSTRAPTAASSTWPRRLRPEGRQDQVRADHTRAPEYQVLDNANHPDAKLGVDGNRQSASLYDMIPAKPQNAEAVRRVEHGQDHGLQRHRRTLPERRERTWSTTCGPRSGQRCSTRASSARKNGPKPTTC